jgi:NhaA family Na+:H+ antiporter
MKSGNAIATVIDRYARSFERFFKTEALSGLLLLASAIAALAVANSPWGDHYEHLWHVPLSVGLSGHALTLTVHGWINDVLMAVFFLLVGLEIKRELIGGELSSRRQAALPIAAAIGGMLVPALIYFLMNPAGDAMRGWAIPMATDIAFAIGTLALVAPSVPSSAKVFLTALAIVDDMGAVAVIAVAYTATIDMTAMLWVLAAVAALVGLNVARVRWLAPFLLVGAVLWWFVHAAGVHSTIAGVLLALTIPATSRDGRPSPLQRLEHALHGVSAFAIMPLFAFANAGIRLGSSTIDWPIVAGIVLGLAVGKLVGITTAAWGATKAGVASLPEGVGWPTIAACGSIGGIGLTMSLFIAGLAFEGTTHLDSAKIGILGGSLVSALVGTATFKLFATSRSPGASAPGSRPA